MWEATDEVLARPVAVKILHPHLAADETFVARFRREAIAAARLSHPSIVAIYDTCSDDGVEAIVMELVRGTTLRDVLDEQGALDPPGAADIAAQVADALDAAHGRARPPRRQAGNILLSDDGRVMVTDFGIAKAAESGDLTQDGHDVGTAKYLSPEQVEASRSTPAPTSTRSASSSTRCSAGGRRSRPTPTLGHRAGPPHTDPPRPRQSGRRAPASSRRRRCGPLARDPDDRYPTAAELRAALLGAGADDPADAVDRRRRRRRPARRPAAALGRRTPGPATAAPAPPPARARPWPVAAPSATGWSPLRCWSCCSRSALGVAGLLIVGDSAAARRRHGDGPAPTDAPPATNASPITGRRRLRPARRRRGERRRARRHAIDGDPTTAWRPRATTTRRLRQAEGRGRAWSSRSTAAPTLDRARGDVAARRAGAPRSTWPTSRAPTTLAGWGEPVASGRALDGGTASFDLDGEGARGAALVHHVGSADDGAEWPRSDPALDDRLTVTARRITPDADDRRPALVAAAQAGDRGALDAPARRHHDRLYAPVPAADGQRRRRPRRHPGGADRHRPGPRPASTAGRRSPPGRTGSPPTPASTSCAAGAAAGPGARRDRPTAPSGAAADAAPRRRRSPPGSTSTPRSARLPDEFRVAVVLRDLCDLDYAEIAEVLDIPPGTVRSRIARGRAPLADLLGGNPAPPPNVQPRAHDFRRRPHPDDLASALLDGTLPPAAATRRGATRR